MGAIGLYMLGNDPTKLNKRHGDKDAGKERARNLSLDPFYLVDDENGTARERLVAAIAKLLTREPSHRGTLVKAEKSFKKLM